MSNGKALGGLETHNDVGKSFMALLMYAVCVVRHTISTIPNMYVEGYIN